MMAPFLFYLLKVNITLIVLFGLYKLFFDKDTFFVWRRFALMGIGVASLLLPLIPFGSITPTVADTYPQGIITVELSDVMISGGEDSSLSWIQILGITYLVVATFFVLRLLANIFQLIRLLSKSPKAEIDGLALYQLQPGTPPFSFFGYIFLSLDACTEAQLSEIIRHELTHARQLHSADILFIQLMIILCWFNPFAWLMLREVRINHEYLADESVIQTGADKKAYLYHLLQASYPTQAAANLYSNFNVLPLKKRIMMMNKKRSKSALTWKYLLFLPVTALLCVIVNCTSKVEESTSDGTEMDEIVVVSYDKGNAQPAVEGEKINTRIPSEIDGSPVFDAVEQMPTYPGGMQDLMRYLATSIKYPKQAQEDGKQGRVIVQFIVDKNGSVTNVNVVRGVDPALDAEAIRIVSAMPKWEPGMQKGQPVNVKFTLPVNFKLD